MINKKSPDLLLLHTQKMMLTAIEGRWDDLMRMQLVQDKMLKILFSKANITFSELAKNNLSEIQRLNQNILDETNNKMGRVEELRMAS
jgi:hypothetical protein